MSITPISKDRQNEMVNEEHEELMSKMDRLIEGLSDQVRAIDDLVRVVDEELVLIRELVDKDLDEDEEEPNTVTLMSGEKVVLK